jgi:sarcosine oxidase subunit delta
MKHFDCPVIGRRPQQEFLCSGASIDIILMDDADAAREALYFGDATARVKREWWYHKPSRLWFLLQRDTGTDTVMSVELATQVHDHDRP